MRASPASLPVNFLGRRVGEAIEKIGLQVDIGGQGCLRFRKGRHRPRGGSAARTPHPAICGPATPPAGIPRSPGSPAAFSAGRAAPCSPAPPAPHRRPPASPNAARSVDPDPDRRAPARRSDPLKQRRRGNLVNYWSRRPGTWKVGRHPGRIAKTVTHCLERGWQSKGKDLSAELTGIAGKLLGHAPPQQVALGDLVQRRFLQSQQTAAGIGVVRGPDVAPVLMFVVHIPFPGASFPWRRCCESQSGTRQGVRSAPAAADRTAIACTRLATAPRRVTSRPKDLHSVILTAVARRVTSRRLQRIIRAAIWNVSCPCGAVPAWSSAQPAPNLSMLTRKRAASEPRRATTGAGAVRCWRPESERN